jgi:hypothetical protein
MAATISLFFPITDNEIIRWSNHEEHSICLERKQKEEPHEYTASPWLTRHSNEPRFSARYNRLLADGVLWIARVGRPPCSTLQKVMAVILRPLPPAHGPNGRNLYGLWLEPA